MHANLWYGMRPTNDLQTRWKKRQTPSTCWMQIVQSNIEQRKSDENEIIFWRRSMYKKCNHPLLHHLFTETPMQSSLLTMTLKREFQNNMQRHDQTRNHTISNFLSVRKTTLCFRKKNKTIFHELRIFYGYRFYWSFTRFRLFDCFALLPNDWFNVKIFCLQIVSITCKTFGIFVVHCSCLKQYFRFVHVFIRTKQTKRNVW